MAFAGMKKSIRPRSEEEAQEQSLDQAPQSDETPIFQQQDPEQTLQQLAAAPSAKEQAQAQAQPESDVDAYQRLSREAEQAAPTEQDVMAAGIRRSMAESRAETPAFLQQMAETAFYKPDYSQMTKVAQAEAERPDIQLTAKQQAQKRLEDLAEGARKRALLPGEMKRQEASAAEAQARMEALKESSALKARANEPASPEDVAKFNKAYGFLKITLPDNITRGDLSKAWNSAPELAAKYATAEKGGEVRKEVAQTQAQAKVEASENTQKRLENKDFSSALDKTRAEYTKAIQPFETKLAGIQNIERLANSNNWQAYAAVAPQMAKIVGGDTGALTDRDLARYSQNPQLFKKYKDMALSAITGTPSEETKQGFIEVARTIASVYRDKIAEKQNQYRNQLKGDRRFVSANGTDEDINSVVFGGRLIEKPASSTSSSGTKQQKLDDIDRKMKELEDRIKSAK